MGKHRAGTERAQQAEKTRERLVDTACRLFARDGFGPTSMDAIAEAAGVTKGALYHHFADKRTVFAACYQAAHERLDGMIRSAPPASSGDRFDAFVDGCIGFLSSVLTEPWVVVLTVAEGPGALGHADWATLDAEYAWTTMGQYLDRMQQRGEVRADVDVVTLTALLNAAINEAAMRIVRADRPEQEFERAAPALRALLAGVRS